MRKPVFSLGNDHTLRFIFLTNLKYFGIFRPISVFETTAIIRTSKFTVFYSGSFCQIYSVTDEALIAETMEWPNFFLMNVFFALKGSKLFTIISNQVRHKQGCTTIEDG